MANLARLLSSPNGVGVLLFILMVIGDFAAADDSKNSTDDDSGTFDEDFANNVFTDLGP
jgi:hypothetical protein